MNGSTYRQMKLREQVMKKLGGKCAFCGSDGTGSKLWIDKIKPDGDSRKTGMSYLNKILWDKTGNFRLLCAHHKMTYKRGTYTPDPKRLSGWPEWKPEDGEKW